MWFTVCRRAIGTGFQFVFALDPDMGEMMCKWLELHGGNFRGFLHLWKVLLEKNNMSTNLLESFEAFLVMN